MRTTDMGEGRSLRSFASFPLKNHRHSLGTLGKILRKVSSWGSPHGKEEEVLWKGHKTLQRSLSSIPALSSILPTLSMKQSLNIWSWGRKTQIAISRVMIKTLRSWRKETGKYLLFLREELEHYALYCDHSQILMSMGIPETNLPWILRLLYMLGPEPELEDRKRNLKVTLLKPREVVPF